jgi:hypothetical protein
MAKRKDIIIGHTPWSEQTREYFAHKILGVHRKIGWTSGIFIVLVLILVVSEEAPKIARKTTEVEDFLEQVIGVGEEALAQTPDMLPVLKKAGVIDAGGRGLLVMFAGFLAALRGDVNIEINFENDSKGEVDGMQVDLDALGEIEFAYCTEFEAAIENFKEKLMGLGDSVLCIGDLSLIKVHIHTNDPGIAITHALELGEVDSIKIDNMLEQNRQLVGKSKVDLKPFGMVSVCAGDGLSSIFSDLLVDCVLAGGQTMNPSAEDIAKGVWLTRTWLLFQPKVSTRALRRALVIMPRVQSRKILTRLCALSRV